MTTPHLAEQISTHRDRMWRGDDELRVEKLCWRGTFIDRVGFVNTRTDFAPPGRTLKPRHDTLNRLKAPRNVKQFQSVDLF